MSFCPGIGNPNAKIMFIGDWPGQTEVDLRESLVGSSGEVLDRVFREIDEPDYRTKFYFSNVYKYRPNDIKKLEGLDIQERNLWTEIQEINPNVIVTLGELPLNTVCGVKKVMTYRGTILPNEKYGYLPKVLPTIHPLHLAMPTRASGDYFEDKKLYNGIWKNILQLDILKAIKEARTREFNPPERLLKVATNSLDVIRFFDRNKGRIPYVDVETYRSTICSCVGISFDEYEALSIPLFQKVGDINLCTIPHRDLVRIWQEIQKLFNQVKISGQNLKFDQAKLELLGFRMAVNSDVMLKAHTVNSELPSVSLSFLSSIYTQEPYYKDEGKEFNPAKHDIKRLFLYNAKDCVVTAEIDKALEVELHELSEEYHTNLVDFYYNYVIPQHQFYFDIEKVGFNIDDGKLAYLRMKYETWKETLQVKLDAAAGYNININSPKQVNEFIYGKLRLPILDKYGKVSSDEDTIARLLKDRVRNEAKREVLNSILEFRRVSKTLSTYLLCKRDYDGRIRSQYRIIGTETGRSSTSILSEPVRPEDLGFAFQTLTKHGDIGNDIRSYLVPRPGYDLVSVDLSQAEARVVCVLCKDWPLLEAFDKIDIHRRTAGLALISGHLNLSEEFDPTCDSLGKDSPERFMGKKVRHAGNYNMKWREFMSNVISDCRRFNIEFTISKFLAEKILDRFHAASPNIRGVFHAEVKQALDTSRALITPYGRLRRFFDRSSDRLYGEGFAYIPQETVKGRLTRAGFRIKKEAPQVLICGEAHDSFTMQIPTGETLAICKEVIKPAFSEPIDFSNCTLKRDFRLVLPCDFEHGPNYKDMVKLKF